MFLLLQLVLVLECTLRCSTVGVDFTLLTNDVILRNEWDMARKTQSSGTSALRYTASPHDQVRPHATAKVHLAHTAQDATVSY